VDIHCIPNRHSGWRYSRPELECKKHFPEPAIVSTVRRGIEAQQLRTAFFVDIEPGDKVVTLE
jgi:hypothetical protein